ncbi:helix-turn-helix domain-containing protein [Streptomyces sp. NPDC090493]|uniref:helix-turn-helix domain-containing protein n=1 Tax=Streptomyces sp. NPDC090493 TaxID=3365964 RepID=UPI003820D3C3
MVGATRRRRRFRKAATKIIMPDTRRKMSGEFMTVQETAEYLNVSASWIYRNATRSGLTPYRFTAGANAKIRFRVSEVEAWIRQQRSR